MDKKRIIGLDVGDRRIGIAVSDPLGLTAQPVETYTRVGYGPDTKHIRALADQYGTDQILCGLPRNMDGTEGFQVDKVREFAGKLQEAGLSVQYYDERMTTIQAESLLLEGGLHRDERKRKVDMVAAVMILQSFLDAEAQKKKAEQAAEKDADEAEEDEDIWTFEDEDGSPVKLHLVYELRYEGIRYLLFNDMNDPDPDADFIVMAERSEDGETVFESVDDEKLLERIYEQYIRNSDQ
jgi:putative Holliday junction resolvase